MTGDADIREDLIEQFVQEFTKDFRGGAAARRVGVHDGSARSWASRLLDRPEVKDRVRTVLAQRRERVKVESDDVLRTLVQIASTDVNDLVEFRRTCCHHCWGLEFGFQRTDGAFKAARMRHAKGQQEAERKAKLGGTPAPDPEVFDELGGPGYIATRDPNPECPECNGDGVGSTFIKDTRELGTASAIYAGVKVTKEGIEVKLQDRMKALELLGKHLGMFADSLNVKGELTVVGLASKMRSRRASGVEDLV